MLLAGDRQSLRARARRRNYPVHVYCGKNGSGKSLAAVYDTLPDLEAGRPVLSTVRILDYENPRPCDDPLCPELELAGLALERPELGLAHDHLAAHPCYVPFTKWSQLLEHRGGPVIMDEVVGVATSGDTTIPAAVQELLQQLRRADVSVRITGLGWMRVNKALREAANAVTVCRSILPESRGDGDRQWRARRLALWRTYDAQSLPLDDHTRTAYQKADKLVSGRHWIPASPAIHAYDTLDAVLRVGTVSDRGRCASCGGTRRAPVCSCPDYSEGRHAGGGRGGPRVRGRAPQPEDAGTGGP